MELTVIFGSWVFVNFRDIWRSLLRSRAPVCVVMFEVSTACAC